MGVIAGAVADMAQVMAKGGMAGAIGIAAGADAGVARGTVPGTAGRKVLFCCQYCAAWSGAGLLLGVKVLKVAGGTAVGIPVTAAAGIAMVGMGARAVVQVSFGLKTLVGPLAMRSNTTLDSTLPKSRVAHESSTPEEASSFGREGDVS